MQYILGVGDAGEDTLVRGYKSQMALENAVMDIIIRICSILNFDSSM